MKRHICKPINCLICKAEYERMFLPKSEAKLEQEMLAKRVYESENRINEW